MVGSSSAQIAFKRAVKRLVQAALFSDMAYRRNRGRALSFAPTYAPEARALLESVSPCPRNIRAEAAIMPEPTVDISVIVPVYNVESYVEECLRSILAQELPEGRLLEVVVVNDGSTDGSRGIVGRIAAEDPRVRVVDQANCGLSGARNTGLDVSRGEYIAFVDSDDFIKEGHLAALFASAEKNGSDVTVALWQRVTEGGASLGLGERHRTNMAPWARLYRREVWSHLRFPVGCWYEDLITPCCLQPLYAEIQIDNEGYCYRIRPGSIVEESSYNPKALDSYWALEELIGWRGSLGITYRQVDLDRFVSLMGPTMMGRVAFLGTSDLMSVFCLCCDLLASIGELNGVHTSLPGAWQDVEGALRTRNFQLWCLACASVATDSGDLNVLTGYRRYRESLKV